MTSMDLHAAICKAGASMRREPTISLKDILDKVNYYAGFDIRGSNRDHRRVVYRALFCGIAFEYGYSPAKIGIILRKDRTTMIHARDSIHFQIIRGNYIPNFISCEAYKELFERIKMEV